MRNRFKKLSTFLRTTCYPTMLLKFYIISTFNVLLTVQHAMILGNCSTLRTNSFQYIYVLSFY